MKYLIYFNESIENNIDNSSNDFTTLYEDDNWIVTKAKSYESLETWSEDGNINMKTHRYDFSNLYLNTNKKDNTKIVLNFDRTDFYNIDDDVIYLKDFFDENNYLFKFYSSIIPCDNIVKDNNDYWLVVKDYSFFEDYFKLDSGTRHDLIKEILSDEGYNADYSTSNFELDENIKLNKDNLDIVKILLFLEKIENDYEYNIDDISDYDDVVSIIEEYDLDDIIRIFKSCICTGHERADSNAAWNDIFNEIVSFFGIDENIIKWDHYNNSIGQMLWLKFNSESDANNAKFIILKPDDSYEDDIIEYSPPYYGYSGDSKYIVETFNEEFIDRITEYDNVDVNYDKIIDYYNFFKEKQEINPNIKITDIYGDYKIYLDTKKFNI